MKRILLFTFLFLSHLSHSQTFTKTNFATGLGRAVGFVCDPNGNFLVWEQSGKVWFVSKDGVVSTSPILDISPEVFNSSQLGFMNVVLDPNYLENGLIYTFYNVDMYWELLANKSTFVETLGDKGYRGSPSASILRVTRFKLNNITGVPVLQPDSRHVLIAPTRFGAPVTTAFSHAGGGMAFGYDGTLLIAIGDGARDSGLTTDGDLGSDEWTDWKGPLIDNIWTSNAENIGTLRVLSKDNYAGKLLRIDPKTGEGIPSNPYFVASSPGSVRSQIWGYGLRNPFKLSFMNDLKGSPHRSLGNPGTFLVCDVGSAFKEELSIVTGKSQFFGWPKFEGIDVEHIYSPLPTWSPAPGDSLVPPFLEYRNSPGRSVKKDGTIFTIPGVDTLRGSSTSGGFLYTKTDFPSEYHNTIFTADFLGRAIYYIKLDDDFNATGISTFATNVGNLTHIGTNPKLDGLFYTTISGQLGRFQYVDTSTTYSPINAKIVSSHSSGHSPSLLNLHSEATTAPSYSSPDELNYTWDLGDGTTYTTRNIAHVYSSNTTENYKIKLTVDDGNGNYSYDSTYYSLNSMPAKIITTSINTINSIPVSASSTYSLSFTSDLPVSDSLVTWRLVKCHDGHEHPRKKKKGNSTSMTLPGMVCDHTRGTTWYRIYLDLYNSAGTVKESRAHDFYHNCSASTAQTINFPQPNSKLPYNTLTYALSATASSELPIKYFVLEGEGASINGSNLEIEPGFVGKITVRAIQSGNTSFKPGTPIDRTWTIERNPCPEYFVATKESEQMIYSTYNKAEASGKVFFPEPSLKKIIMQAQSFTLKPGFEVKPDSGFFQITPRECPPQFD